MPSAVPEHPDPASPDRLWQHGVVVHDASGRAWLELPDPTVCDRCRRGEGCGSASFLRLFRRAGHESAGTGRVRLPLDREEAARFADGTPVRAGIGGGWLLRAAIRLYLAPLAVFVAALWLAARLFPGSEPAALVLAVAIGAGVMVLTGRGARPPRLALEAATPARSETLESGARRCHLYDDAQGPVRPPARHE